MSTVASLWVKLGLDSKGYSEGLKTAADKTKQVGASMTRTGAMMTAGLTTPIVGAGVAALKMASDLEQSVGGVESVFGDAGKAIFEFGETAAETVGLSKRSFNELSTVGGALLQNLGFDAVGAADEMLKLAQRGSDVAATFGGPVENVLQAVQSALKGEFNPLEQFGVKMNAVGIEARAMQMGLADVTIDMVKLDRAVLNNEKAMTALAEANEEYGTDSIEAREAAQKFAETTQKLGDAMGGQTDKISDAAKAQAALSLFYEQTAKTQGQFASEIDTVAGQTERLKAKMENLSSTLGNKLLPIGLKIGKFVSDLIDKFNALTPAQQKTILIVGAVVAAIGPLITIVGGLISAWGAISGVFIAVSGAIGIAVGPLILIVLGIVAVVALLAAAWKNNWGGIQGKTAAAVAWISEKVKAFLDAIKAWWAENGEAIKVKVMTAWVLIKIIFEKYFSFLKSLFQAFSAAFQGDWYAFGEKLREAWDKAWELIKIVLGLAWIAIKGIMEKLVTSVISFFKTTDWGQVGRNIITGIGNGIASMGGWLAGRAAAAAKAALDAAKGFLGIHSPSKAFGELGKFSAMGFGLQFEKTMSGFQPAMSFAMAGPTQQTRDFGISAAATGQSSNNSTVNFLPGSITVGANADMADVRRATNMGVQDALRARGVA